MTIKETQNIIVEIFADEGKTLYTEDGAKQEYLCVPSTFDLSTIKEVTIEEIDNIMLLDRAKEKILEKITEYDLSDNVNGFNLMGMTLWIPRETRVSLQNSIAILLKNGITTTTLWEGTLHFNLPCELLLHLLDELEIYALQCFNKTAEHKSNVMQLSSIEEVENYDYTVGYPEKLTFTL